MRRKVTKRKQIPTRTLGNLNVRKKVEVKPHTRKNRNGKRVMVKAYERKVGGSKDSISKSTKTKSSSGVEFERLKSRLTPYGAKAKEGLKTFQANGEDVLSVLKDSFSDRVKRATQSVTSGASFVGGQVGKTIKHYTRKSKKASTKKKDMIGKRWNKFDVAMQDFMSAHGSNYKKYF